MMSGNKHVSILLCHNYGNTLDTVSFCCFFFFQILNYGCKISFNFHSKTIEGAISVESTFVLHSTKNAESSVKEKQD